MGICSVDGCDRPYYSRGWCAAHYQRWQKHGDALHPTKTEQIDKFFREVVMTYDGNECLTWPFTTTSSGYGQMHRKGVHRVVCEETNGPPPTPEHEAAHSCGKGHLGCVTKRHLSWKTSAKNKEDMIAHGTALRGEKHGNSRLTETDVRRIIAMKGVMPQAAIADQFDVCPATVAHIHTGRNWGWL